MPKLGWLILKDGPGFFGPTTLSELSGRFINVKCLPEFYIKPVLYFLVSEDFGSSLIASRGLLISLLLFASAFGDVIT